LGGSVLLGIVDCRYSHNPIKIAAIAVWMKDLYRLAQEMQKIGKKGKGGALIS
jgi:hypothetical protein